MKFDIVRAGQVDADIREQMAAIFAEGFSQWLVYFSKDPQVIAKAFAHMFVLDQFYVAMTGDTVAGFAGCTDCIAKSVVLDGRHLRKHLGLIKGSIAALVLKKEFESPIKDPQPCTGSIEFVGTAAAFRGQGVASQILRHVIEHTPYETYLIEEVADTNVPAMSLYQKLGFQEYKSRPIPPKGPKKIGINRFVSFRYTNNDR